MNKQKEITLRKNDERERNTGKTKPQNITEGSEKEICMGCNKYLANIRLDEDVLKTSFVFVFRGRLQDVLIKTNIFALALHLQKTSWSRPIYSSWPYVFKTF